MTAERWEQIKVLVDRVLDQDAGTRSSFLQEACGGDRDLRAEVDRLAGEFEKAGAFLETPAVEFRVGLTAGDVIAGRYRISALLGRGGMGEVYRAEDQLLHETVALKTLRIDLSQSEVIARQFQKEIQLARKVTHPNVCRIYDAGEYVHPRCSGASVQFFSMELVEGETLSSIIRAGGRLSRVRAFPIARQMAQGLAAAHQAGVVHRDFKSSNVLVAGPAGAERVVITDFGLARFDPRQDEKTSPGTDSSAGFGLAGTFAFMSPEQLAGEPVTSASDIYAFGIVLFEMATGKLPFDDRHIIQGAMQRVGEPSEFLRARLSAVDPRWTMAIERCLQTDPKRRFPSAAALAEWFSDSQFRMPRLYWTRRRWMASGGIALSAVAGAAAIWTWVHRPYVPPPTALEWYERGESALDSMTFGAARKALEQAVAADPKFALAHASLAWAYAELDDSEHADAAMLAALTAAGQTRLLSGDALRLRALQYVVARDFSKAAELFGSLESLAEPGARASAALKTGWMLERADKTPEAIQSYRRAQGFSTKFAAPLLRLAVLLARLRRIPEALAQFDRAEALYNASSDYEGLTETLYQRATTLTRSGRSAEALPQIHRALAITATTANQDQRIRLMLLESVAYRNLDDTAKALSVSESAVQFAIEHGMQAIAGRGLIDLGNVFFVRGEREPAEQNFQRALSLARQGKAHQSEARANLSLGSLRAQYDESAQAGPYVEAALAFYRPNGFRRESAQALLLLGTIHVDMAQYDQSQRALQDALVETAQLGDPGLEGQIHGELGQAYCAQGAWPRAVDEYETARRFIRGGLTLAYNLVDRGSVYWRLDRVAESEQAFREAGDRIQRLQGSQDQLRVRLLAYRAEMAYGLGRFREASALARQATATAADSTSIDARNVALISALAALRTAGGGSERANSIIVSLDQDRKLAEAARARLLLAEALLTLRRAPAAFALASASLEFFESRSIHESLWRVRRVMAMADSDASASAEQWAAAGKALQAMQEQWTRGSLEAYARVLQQSGISLSWFLTDPRYQR